MTVKNKHIEKCRCDATSSQRNFRHIASACATRMDGSLVVAFLCWLYTRVLQNLGAVDIPTLMVELIVSVAFLTILCLCSPTLFLLWALEGGMH